MGLVDVDNIVLESIFFWEQAPSTLLAALSLSPKFSKRALHSFKNKIN